MSCPATPEPNILLLRLLVKLLVPGTMSPLCGTARAAPAAPGKPPAPFTRLCPTGMERVCVSAPERQLVVANETNRRHVSGG